MHGGLPFIGLSTLVYGLVGLTGLLANLLGRIGGLPR
ncbi:hypothetical protein DSC45_12170 [Streptomyces sp. YIM 130001]|nr:hypothetical protein DSC45_12170 [Streptomyces sp. YIM 130001]